MSQKPSSATHLVGAQAKPPGATHLSRATRWWRTLRGEVAKKLRRPPSPAALSDALAGRDLVFKAPRLDAALVAAIQRITPQFHWKEDELSRRVWELSQNGSCWGEYEALEGLLRALPRPSRVLELGPGLGRSAVFFKKKLEWQGVPFDLFDGDGPKQKYPLGAERSANSFCGDLAALRKVLDHNGVEAARIVNAHERGGSLAGLQGPYDLVYSFYGVGFHWALSGFWEEIQPLLSERATALFTVTDAFQPFEALRAHPFGFVPFDRILTKDRTLRILVVGEGARSLAGRAARS